MGFGIVLGRQTPQGLNQASYAGVGTPAVPPRTAQVAPASVEMARPSIVDAYQVDPFAKMPDGTAGTVTFVKLAPAFAETDRPLFVAARTLPLPSTATSDNDVPPRPSAVPLRLKLPDAPLLFETQRPLDVAK